MGKVLVVGSLNVDMHFSLDRFPKTGETIVAHHLSWTPGGKGANQALAARKAGAEVRMVGRVGDDALANMPLVELQKEGVDLQYVTPRPKTSTGLAAVMVDASAQNQILIVAGANGEVYPKDLSETIFSEVSHVLVQLEIPRETVLWVLQKAKIQGLFTLLDPAPVQALNEDFLSMVDLLLPNEHEAYGLTGLPTDTIIECRVAAERLRQKGAGAVVIKRGDKGALYLSETEEWIFEPTPVVALDTTGAGDCYSGYTAALLAQGYSRAEALRLAGVASALSVTREGAQVSMPNLSEVKQFSARKEP